MVAARTELNQIKLLLRILVEFPKLDSFTKVKSFRKVTSGSGSEIIRGLTSFNLCLFIGLFLFTAFFSNKTGERLLLQRLSIAEY